MFGDITSKVMKKKSVEFILLSNGQAPSGWSFLAKLLTALLGVVGLVLAFMFSVVLLAVVGVAVLVLFIYFWWKTRHLRQQIKDFQENQEQEFQYSNDRVYEGESRREDERI